MKIGKILGFIIILASIGYLLGNKSKNNNKNIQRNYDEAKPTQSEEKLKVAIMADIHSDIEQFGKMLLKVKYNGTDLLIIAGDLIDNEKNGGLVDMKTILDKSGLKYAVVPGDREKNLNNFKNIFGSNYQTIEMKKVKFILIDNTSWHGLGAEQKKWIEKEVGNCQEKICVAIMHKPLNNLFSAQIMGEGNEKVVLEAQWLRELLIKSGVRRIEAADLHYSTSYELEGIRTDIVGAISRLDNLQSSRYTELMISENSIERRVVEETNDIGN